MKFHTPLRLRLSATFRLLSVGTVVFAAGCATPYKEPTGSNVASIEFIDETSQPMSVHLHGDAKECTDRVNTGGVQPNSRRKVVVRAEQSTAFTVGMDPKGLGISHMFGALGALLGANTYKGCTPTLDFIPEAGRTYVFRMNSDASVCSYQFFARPLAGQPADEAVPVNFTQREWIRASTETGPFCKKK
jgi:hypothetical protein